MASRAPRSSALLIVLTVALALVTPTASGQATMPRFRVYPYGQTLWGAGWGLGIPIAVTVERAGVLVGTTDVEPWDGGEYGGSFWLHLPTDTSPRFTVRPGDTVRMLQGSLTKTHVVLDVVVTDVDEAADVVSGTAPPGAEVGVGVSGAAEGDWAYRNVVAAANGSWTADFSVADQDGSPPHDVRADVQTIEAEVFDADEDGTSFPWSAPSVRVQASDDRVWGFDWAVGTVTLEVDDPATPADPDVTTHATTVCRILDDDQVLFLEDLPDCADGLGSTAVDFDLGAFDVVAGHRLSAADAAGHVASIVVADIEVLEIRTDTSTILARGPAGMQLAVFDAMAIGWSEVEQVATDRWAWHTYDPPCVACGMLGPGIDGVVATDRVRSGTQVSWRVDDWPMEFYRLGTAGGATWSARYLMWPLLDRVRTKVEGDGPYRLKRQGSKRWSAWLDLDPTMDKLEALLVRYGRGEVVLLDRTSGTTLAVRVVVVRP